MSDAAGPSDQPKVKKARKSKAHDEPIMSNKGVVKYLNIVLGEFFQQEKLQAAIEKARQDPDVQALLDEEEGGDVAAGPKGKVKSRREKKEPKPKSGLIRSAYNVYATVALAALKAAKVESNLSEVGSLWKRLPVDVRADMTDRYSVVKDRHNAAVSAGGGAPVMSVVDELSAYEREEGLPPFQYPALLRDYCNAQVTVQPQAPGSTAKAAAAKAAAAPVALTPVAAPPPVGTPAPGPVDASALKKKKKHRDHAAEGVSGAEGGESHKKKKKHKKDRTAKGPE